MDVTEAIETRRAYRSLEKIEISDDVILALAGAARLSPSCFNYQPWRFIFVTETGTLEKIFETLPTNNAWIKQSSMIIAVFAKKKEDCVIAPREYYLFDTGMAVAFMLLRATEMGLVAHPIAGYKPDQVGAILGIPEDYLLITLVIVGKHSETLADLLTEKQIEIEKERPPRKALNEFVFRNHYSNPWE
jgi:nitroreductase